MSAGLTGLTELYTPERARALNDFGDRLRQGLNGIARRHGLAMQFTGIGSMLSVHMTDQPVRSQEDAERGGDVDVGGRVYGHRVSDNSRRSNLHLSITIADQFSAARSQFFGIGPQGR